MILCVSWFILGIGYNSLAVAKIVVAKKWFKLRFFVLSQMLSIVGALACDSLSQIINSSLYVSTDSLSKTCLITCFICAVPFCFTIIYVIIDYRYRDMYLLDIEPVRKESTLSLKEETKIDEVEYLENKYKFENEENEDLIKANQSSAPIQDVPPIEKDTCWSRTKYIFSQMS